MHGTGVYANQFTLMLGARATAGFVRPGDDRGLLDAAIPFPVSGPEPERLLDLMREIGVETETCRVEFTLRDEERRDARRLLGDSCRPLIGLHIGGIGRGKRVDRGLVLEALAQVQAVRGGTVVVLGSPEDRLETAAPWALDCASIIELTGRTSLPVLGGVVAALDVFVGNDSGPAHMAYALGTPSVTLFRNTEPERWGPPQSGPHAVLVEPHSSEAISRKVDELLAATGPALD
jgi:ADP-heptose:LPS heptosyltransferase